MRTCLVAVVLVIVGCNGGEGGGTKKNETPVASGSSLVTLEGDTVEGFVAATDDDGDPLSFAIASAPTSGQVYLDAGTGAFAYIPDAGTVGPDSFGFVASDGQDVSLEATITLDVRIRALDLTFETVRNANVAGFLAVENTSASLVFEIVAPPTQGVVVLDTDTGSFLYTPDVNAIGVDMFTFAADAGAASSEVGTATIDIALLTASYASLRDVLTDVLLVGTSITVDVGCVLGDACPRSNPIEYLDARADQVDGSLSVVPPGSLTGTGYAAWLLASSSACGRMMTEQGTPALYPNGATDYTYLYVALLDRDPTADEDLRLDDLRADFADDAYRGAAVCAAVLGSMEFLSRN